PASRARRVDVRLSATHGTSLVLYFSTDKDPEFSHGRRIVQPLTADGEIHEVRFETAEHPEWKGTITGLRFAIEPEDTAEGDVEVDSIRISEPPPHLVLRRWTVSRAVIRQDETFTIRVTVANDGGGEIRKLQLIGKPEEGLNVVDSDVPD